MNRRVIASTVFAFSVCVGLVSNVQATVIGPGGFVDPLPTDSAANPDLAGVVIATRQSAFTGLDVNNLPRFFGVLTTHVVRETNSNQLSFYYQISNDITSPDSISAFTNTNFGGWITDVLQRDDAMAGIGGGSLIVGTQAVSYATRGLGAGDDISFSLIPDLGAGALEPGDTSWWHVIRTNAIDYTDGNTAIQNGGNANVLTFAPIPEPATLGLVALGALTLLRRRR